MEYANKQTGHVINTDNQLVQLPAVVGNQLYVKNCKAESLKPDELVTIGYYAVKQPSNPNSLPLSEIKWDGNQPYREVLAGELGE